MILTTPGINWPNCAHTSQSRSFLSFINDNVLVQHIDAPTRNKSSAILDLVLTSCGTNLFDIEISEDFGTSDHCTIHFKTALKPLISASYKNIRRNFRRADWDLFRELLSENITASDFFGSRDIDTVWHALLVSITKALDVIVPSQILPQRKNKFSSKVLSTLRHKRRCFKALREDPVYSNRVNYERSMILLHSRLEDDRMKREQHICMKPDAKTFWSFVNRYLNRKRPINSINHGSTPVKDPSRIANIFNEFFSSIFAPFPPLPEFNDNDTSSYTLANSLTNFTVSFDQTSEIINSLPSKSSVDSSGLSYRIIKNGGPMLTHY